VLVVGCGNLIRGDDAAGPVLVRRLAERGVADHVRLLDAGTAGMDVGFAMRGMQRVILVDASSVGVEPGTVHHVPGEEMVDLAPPTGGNLHRFRWDQALGFAQWLLKDEYPAHVEVWLIEGSSYEPGEPLTPAVDAAVDAVADRLIEDLTTPRGDDVGASIAQQGPPAVAEAADVRADVVEESGRFIVYLDVVLSSGAVRRRLSDHPDRVRAETAGREYVRAAGRHLGERPAQARGTL
jgi:hydrogenase maturation protease